LARFGGTLFSALLFLALVFVLLAGPASPGQSAGAAQKKAGETAAPAAGKDKSATESDKPAAANKATNPAEKADSLAPETIHRIQTEIRTHYNVPPHVEIGIANPKSGSITGYDDLAITLSGGGKSSTHDFLISKDRKTLAHLDTYDVSQDLMSQIDVKGRPVRGNPEAKVTIVNFDDFQCPFCSHMHSTLFASLFKDYSGKIKVIYKDYPLIEIHSWAMHAAIDGNCLGEQNSQAYWEFADYVHGNQRLVTGKSREEAYTNLDNFTKDEAQKHQLDQEKLQACVKKQDDSAVRASLLEGDKLGVDSTPTMFINGERFTGAVPEEELRAVLDRALIDSGQKPPAADAKK
jgi:protein-disulfide isomerase